MQRRNRGPSSAARASGRNLCERRGELYQRAAALRRRNRPVCLARDRDVRSAKRAAPRLGRGAAVERGWRAVAHRVPSR